LFVPVHRDLLGVRGEAFLVGVVVAARRDVQEDRLFVPDDCEAVPAVSGDSDGVLVALADDERVYFALCGSRLDRRRYRS
jgi:hypothetical protein